MSDLQQTATQSLLARSDVGQDPAASDRGVRSWGTRDRKTRLLFWSLVAALSVLALMVYAAIIEEMLGDIKPCVNTLALFWSWSKFIHVISPAALIYDPHALNTFERGAISAHAMDLPFAYPPSLLLLIWPLGLLPPVPALLLWLGVSAILYAWACWYRPWGPMIAMLGLAMPSTLAALYCGQVSLLIAAFMIGGCRLVGRRPILAGVLLGLATVKPQFGLLVPVALVSARQWRSAIAAATTVLLTVLVSGLAFGWTTWRRLPSAMIGLSKFAARFPQFLRVSPTVTAVLRVYGAGPALTEAAQLSAAACSAVAIWICFRRGFTPLAVAALMVGAFFTTPYAVFYDLPMVSYAVLAVVVERHQSREPFWAGEIFILILVAVLPVLIIANPLEVPWGVTALVLFFGLILRRIATTRRHATYRLA